VTDRYLCIHGHFYQPPRENPWLDAIETQASAYPYHDWNQRITRECYGPNTRARVHDGDGHILTLINNYARMSFDFGPTLLSYLEMAHPWIYEQILDADRMSLERFEGHGNALAQVYSHIIMPLATTRDKLTQIRWGLADFRRRFGRPAEGMWLSETAVDMETLSLMAGEGVRFTILSPAQAGSVRPLSGSGGEGPWQDVKGEKIDPTRAYRVFLNEDGSSFIDVFFYHGPISRAVAYEKLLSSGEAFLGRIRDTFGSFEDGPALVSLATDGESYGHHFKFGDLALAWLFHHLEEGDDMELMNYGLFLEKFPPQDEVMIVENSSWSCAHGVERWRGDCGCSVGRRQDWNQAWRAPLREGLDWLNLELSGIFEERGGRLFKDPWGARDDYIQVFSDPTPIARDGLVRDHAKGTLRPEEEMEAFRLLECQRMALYMFTSCGWFFDDISGLEPVQVLKYAARAIDLARPWAERDLEAGLMEYLAMAMSNLSEYGDGKRVYDMEVRPARVDPSRAVALHGLALVAGGVSGTEGLFSRAVRSGTVQRLEGENGEALMGVAQVMEVGTGLESTRTFLALRRRGAGLACLVGLAGKDAPGLEPEKAVRLVKQALKSSLGEAEEVIFAHWSGVRRYGAGDLIPDTAGAILEGILMGLDSLGRDYLREHEALLDELFSLPSERKAPGSTVPEDLLPAFLASELDRLFSVDEEELRIKDTRLEVLAARAKEPGLVLDSRRMGKRAGEYLWRKMDRLASQPALAPIKNIIGVLDLAEVLGLSPDLWECQNMFYDLYTKPAFVAGLGPELSRKFHDLGRRLGFLVRPPS